LNTPQKLIDSYKKTMAIRVQYILEDYYVLPSWMASHEVTFGKDFDECDTKYVAHIKWGTMEIYERSDPDKVVYSLYKFSGEHEMKRPDLGEVVSKEDTPEWLLEEDV